MYVTACFSERFVAIFIKGTTIANRRLALKKSACQNVRAQLIRASLNKSWQ